MGKRERDREADTHNCMYNVIREKYNYMYNVMHSSQHIVQNNTETCC